MPGALQTRDLHVNHHQYHDLLYLHLFIGMSALHRLPRDALEMICDFLLQRKLVSAHKGKGFATLLALATTSRFFHEYALNAIWHTLPGYSMLLYTLPRDAWTAEVKPLKQPDVTPITEFVRHSRLYSPPT